MMIVKPDETRHWSTTHRGMVAIHASKTVDTAGAPDALCIAALGVGWHDKVPIGAIVGVGELFACSEASRMVAGLTQANLAAGNFTPGRFAWRFRNVRPLRTPIKALGRQGLWNWEPPADLESRLGPVVNHAAMARYIGWA
jgi:hypothetical protein